MNPTKPVTTNGTSSKTTKVRADRPRVRGSARGVPGNDARDRQYDLLTAALIGVAVGAGTALLLRRGPGGKRPIEPMWKMARAGGRMARRASRFAWDRGVDAWDNIPREEIAERVRDYAESARDTIDDVVGSELASLRRTIKRHRKRMGI
jgi:hypothetical protein